MDAARRYFCCLVCFAVCCSSGCAPGPNGMMRPTLPWTRQLPPPTAQANSPWRPGTDQIAGLRQPVLPPVASRGNSSRWNFLNELMRRADQQELLAQRQREEIARLGQVQSDRYDRERQYVITQREKERQELLKRYEQKQRELAAREEKYRGRFDQLRGKASNLDSNNRDLHAQLAKSQKEREVLQDQIAALKQQLDQTTQQLTQTRTVSRETGRRLQALQASASKTRGNAAIRANSSVGRPITAVQVPGMDIRQDGDLVRIAVPTDRMFMAGTASLHQGSREYLDQIANILRQHYPLQIAGVESHTDHSSGQLVGSQWRNQHQLTAAQAMAVFEQLTARSISPHQLFVLGHGGNHPLVSGGTPEGQAVNRRVEVVVYPETHSR